MTAAEQGSLLVADISGYTGYLAGSELDHAHDVLADLLETVIRALRPVFRLAKLEGDAAFMYAATDRLDGSTLLDTIEACYFGFQRRLDGIHRATTCQCNACRQIPGLNVKFLVHYGEFVRHKIAGRDELTGSDVILVHRLLKNRVTETTGVRGYALITARCLDATGLDRAALGMREHRETYEHMGETVAFVHDLEARWRDEQERTRVYVSTKDADPEWVWTLPAPAQVVWDYLTTTKRPQWMAGLTGFEQRVAGGRRGAGTVNHCAHGSNAIVEEILDWRPFRYLTLRAVLPGLGEGVVTQELVPDGDTTRLFWRRRKDKSRKNEEMWRQTSEGVRAMWDASVARLSEVLAQRPEEQVADGADDIMKFGARP